MRVTRQKTLSFKITKDAEADLVALQAALCIKLARPVSKTDVVEMSLRDFARRNRVGSFAPKAS